MTDLATISLSDDGATLICQGAWDMYHISVLSSSWRRLQDQLAKVSSVDVSAMTKFDSAGALRLYHIISSVAQQPTIKHMPKYHTSLYELVASNVLPNAQKEADRRAIKNNIFYQLGVFTIKKISRAIIFLWFIGELSTVIGKLTYSIKKFHWSGVLDALDDCGYKALPILALMAFLIGVVLAYQLGVQLQQYGANIYIVDLTGIAMLREFAPLITAVIMAGRTSTSFAALIGTMKVNEELDALNTMGIAPIRRLVVPRIMALFIIMPLLVIWADIFGVLGSMLMAQSQLGVNYASFIQRFSLRVSVTEYALGLIKAPFFALIIACIGCFQGFQVEMKAESVGVKTTLAAVQSLFLIIIADAFFSILFSWLGV